jgi:lactoylglutathione lyase
MSDNATIALNLIVIYTADLKAAKAFYTCLGLTFQSERHGKGPEHYAAELGAVVLEIYPLSAGKSRGSVRLGFQVTALDRVLQTLRERSAKIRTEPQDSPWGRRAVVEDPDGNRVELVERKRG